ncbi:DUF5677 domain-containing protein [uncultured Psychromonas sp.]|uniref:DUF5677 domain-containing protein n=1 Tax=uncultured Psychromonas sp. TaxID=173974 RepID=UPI00261E3CD4|nr:DUF5677 domain-containing protein [uncultured Psychromonas sp.]
MSEKEFSTLRKVATLLFDREFSSHLSSEEGRIFYLLSKKFLNHINSFYTVLNGTNFNDVVKNSEQIDHSSAKILLRASFESYLVMTHLFYDKPDLTEIRVLLYRHSGLKERQNKLPTKNLDDALQEKMNLEAELIKTIEESIENLSSKLNLNHTHISKAVKEGWSTGNGWVKIGLKSSLPNKYVNYVYPYLCGYSHSGFESLMQLSTDENCNNQEVREKQTTLYFFATYLLANFSKSYCLYSKSTGYENIENIGAIDTFLQKYQGVYS